MLISKKKLATFLVALPLYCLAQTSLTSLDHTRYYTEKDWDEYSSHSLTIYGKNLWPDYMSLSMSIELVKVYFKKGEQVLEIPVYYGNKEYVRVVFSGKDWLNSPGMIEVYVMIDDIPIDGIFSRTNSLWIKVESMPEVPPVITKIAPVKLFTGLKSADYCINIYGENFGADRTTTAMIAAGIASPGFIDLLSGYMNVWIPKSIINTPGTYDVQVKTKYGTSNTVQFVIEKPPLTMQKIIGLVTNRPTETKPANQIANTPITVNTSPDLRAGERMANGIKVKMLGNIIYGEDGVILEQYINGLDNVIIVDNQMKNSDNNMNMLFEISGKGIMQPELEKVKASIENKLREMSFQNAVVIIK